MPLTKKSKIFSVVKYTNVIRKGQGEIKQLCRLPLAVLLKEKSLTAEIQTLSPENVRKWKR